MVSIAIAVNQLHDKVDVEPSTEVKTTEVKSEKINFKVSYLLTAAG